MLSCPVLANAQLISPGRLADVHADMTGVRSCTQCHSIGKSGTSNDKCLDCHVPLRNRVAEGKGLHARFAEENCAACHKDHFGTDFDIVRFDTTAFEHDSTGFALGRGHGQLGCRECHRSQFIVAPDVSRYAGEHGIAETTFLGLGAACLTCHEADDPHAGQFLRRACDECHADSAWDDLSAFDHDRTRYRLIGLHRDVACEDCHEPIHRQGAESYVQYVEMAFSSCADCHDDEHEGEMGEKCAECHNARGWEQINRSRFEARFDHNTTDFQLVGAHADADCTSCHGPRPTRNADVYIRFVAATDRRTYQAPVSDECLSCHRDSHSGEFDDAPNGAGCDNCHNQTSWDPAEYDIARHNADAGFTLTGAHVATPCNACHEIPDGERQVVVWHFDTDDCVSCHAPDDPHEAQFPDAACDECHDEQAFTIAAFDHDNTRYGLDGEHENVPCADCHPEEQSPEGLSFVRYAPLGMDCADCHGPR